MSDKPRRSRAVSLAALRLNSRPGAGRATPGLAGLVAVLSLTACGGGPELTASVDTMVELESALQCDITRFAHPDAEAVESYRDTVRQRFAVSAEDHKIFLDMMLDDEALRGQVADRTDALCPPPADDVEVES